ncbi:DUF3047 domain-containing protein [Mesorhizobium sp. YIM 152430]|uniref:DUF3047 domain-containing protein n=1 Tax=Mesorhizobium sp. YIM 152430 TaxID=3031761 RepID=UPI0023DB6023|nr:DUF3047 domain-containing protein [Mesorhizobium sp. YIM 152430]MDF1600244.1 DUF3047 domain-containing protein [Mesorhizobium sp. YIM 152430]
MTRHPPLTLSRRQLCIGFAASSSLFLTGTGTANAADIRFDESWEHLTFRRLIPNVFQPARETLKVVADGSSSILYRMLEPALHGAQKARWTWEVGSSVPPSDLSTLGEDDRNLGMFFVSLDAANADRVRPGTNIRSLMANRSARILMYTWGGNTAPGTIVPSPHAPERLRNLITREAGTGRFTEEVDLAADFPRVFGQPLDRLVAVAVSSNSENTPARVDATVSNLTVS